MKEYKLLFPLSIVLIAALMRIVPHPVNVAPIAAMALFGGVYLDKKYALFLPLAAMFISDLFLGFHASMFMVYVSFVLTGLIGLWVRKHKNVATITGASLASSVIFFLLTNFNYWYAVPLYPKTIEGILQSYVMALPFFRNTILGDLFYTGVFFGAYELVKSTVVKLTPTLAAHKKTYADLHKNRR